MKKLLLAIGGIDDQLIEEAEAAYFTHMKRKRIAKYGSLAAAAVFGIAVTFRVMRLRKAA